MPSEKPGSDYAIGYGKPPRKSCFKKGQSGNPAGRPKGRLNLATVLERTLHERVVINENGQRKIITKLEAALKQLVNKAASGDLDATRQLMSMARSAEETSKQAPPTKPELNEVDRKVMHNVLQRWEKSAKEGRN